MSKFIYNHIKKLKFKCNQQGSCKSTNYLIHVFSNYPFLKNLNTRVGSKVNYVYSKIINRHHKTNKQKIRSANLNLRSIKSENSKDNYE